MLFIATSFPCPLWIKTCTSSSYAILFWNVPSAPKGPLTVLTFEIVRIVRGGFAKFLLILIPVDLKLDLRAQARTWHSKWPSLTSCYQFNSKLMKNWLLQVRQIPNIYDKVSMEYLCSNLITLCTYVHHKNNVCGKEYANDLWPSNQSN